MLVKCWGPGVHPELSDSPTADLMEASAAPQTVDELY